MKTNTLITTLVLAVVGQFTPQVSHAQTVADFPPVVIKTMPESGRTDVLPGEIEIKATFSKLMADQSWSWCTVWDNSCPDALGKPHYEADQKSCVMKVKLEPGKTYGYWLNTKEFKNFRDQQGHSAVPYLLVFSTKSEGQTAEAPEAEAVVNFNHDADLLPSLNSDQRSILTGTDRRFGSFFDNRNFDGWSAGDRTALEGKLLDSLKGPKSQEYYQAINTLAALRSTQALAALRTIAFDRAEKDNRDRWMATRALGIMGDKESVPQLIHLLYHMNANTRWWAQISLVRMTGTNFGKDWKAWGKWWNDQHGQPPYQPQIIRWWGEQPEPDKLVEKINELDNEFLSSTQPQSGENYLQQQLKLAQAGNYWAKVNLWEGYAHGKHEIATNSAEASKWLPELVKGAYLAKFKPVGDFNPKTPSEMLDQFSEQCHLFSGKDRLGGASFFRTTKHDGKLIGSFLTDSPDEFKAAIKKNPQLKLISINKVTPKMFLSYEASPQESL